MGEDSSSSLRASSTPNIEQKDEKDPNERDQWTNQLEFLLSCISMSVGLGNVWRFPFTAYENGGGAFLIPYFVVLLLLGKPLYYLELVMGQFSSYGCVGIWNAVPAFKVPRSATFLLSFSSVPVSPFNTALLGALLIVAVVALGCHIAAFLRSLKSVGYGQTIGTSSIVTYYVALMALTLYYALASMSSTLPWSYCDPRWADMDSCVDANVNVATRNLSFEHREQLMSSAEMYFQRQVMQSVETINDGIGMPRWPLVLCLLASWVTTLACIVKGVKSSGKVAYFTATFPYVILLTLFVRGITLPGAVEGILFYVKPQWDQLLNPQVWFAAVTQCFFSLGVSFGALPMMASYNTFNHRIARDATIITTIDMLTSFLAGFTIFSVLGNLAYQQDTTVENVIKTGGPGLAFISYPQALANFPAVPQLFSVLFFLMLFTLGLGTSTALTSGVITVICDAVPSWRRWVVATIVCTIGFLIGIVYVTPGGLIILDLVDFFGGSFIIFALAVLEIMAIVWIYGVTRLSQDIKFMLGSRPSFYWRFSWKFVTPVMMTVIFIYSMISLKPPTYGQHQSYPDVAIASGWTLAVIALVPVLICFFCELYRCNERTLIRKLKGIMKPNEQWGPMRPEYRLDWEQETGVKNTKKGVIEAAGMAPSGRVDTRL